MTATPDIARLASAANGESFPPSSADSPLAYGFALFSLSMISVVAIAVLMALFIEWRGARENRMFLPLPIARNCSDLNVALRVALVMFSMFLLAGALPDALILLSWGEVSIPTLRNMLIIDRTLDGLIIFPFLAGCFVLSWVWPSLTQSVAEIGVRNSMPPLNRRMVIKIARVPALLLLISVGVTIGKASV